MIQTEVRQECQECGRAFRDTHNPSRKLCGPCRAPKDLCGCGEVKRTRSKRCATCRGKVRGPEHPTYRGGRTRHTAGYVMESDATRGRYVFQHILVMDDAIGRLLLPGETVHHLNGIKDDNRPENLQLWTRPQPTGIRAEDAVAHALEVLRRYAPNLLT